MAIGAQQVKELRDRTGAAMMDCKAALQEAEGDLEKAIELLRVKGQASAEKRAGRSTSASVRTSIVPIAAAGSAVTRVTVTSRARGIESATATHCAPAGAHCAPARRAVSGLCQSRREAGSTPL